MTEINPSLSSSIGDQIAEALNTPLEPMLESQQVQTSNGNVMALHFSESLSRTFVDLRSKNEDVRLRASYNLHGLVTTAARGMSLTR